MGNPSFHRRASGHLVTLLAVLWCFVTPTLADGIGQIGMGSILYKPVCGHACRKVIANSKLLCDSRMPGSSGGHSPGEEHVHRKRHVHAAALNTKECYLQDAAFLRTFALCLEHHCGHDNIPASEIEWYWDGHVGHSKSIGVWTEDMKPLMSYGEALWRAKADLEANNGEAPYVVPGEPLNVTSLVQKEDVMLIYRSLSWFEEIQSTMTWNSVGAAISMVFFPVVFSLFRFLPGRALWYSRLVAFLEKPVIGHRHRTPVVADLGYMPTRGQSLYLLYLFTTQLFLTVFPLPRAQTPITFAETRQAEIIMTIGDRSGVMGTANFVALFLFSSRNNVLLWITNWSHGTFLLLHRWIGYATILQVVVHSVVLLVQTLYWGDHASESQMEYWIWGIVGTLLFVIIWPLALLPIRKKAYEVFLALHQVFAALALIATFMHLYTLYGYAWGYEYWVYVAGILWFVDRAVRVLRVLGNGWRKAVVTPIAFGPGSEKESEGEVEYVRVDVEGVVAEGHVYLYFPTLGWRFWECHPFSVISTFTGGESSAHESGSEAEKRSTTSTSSSSRGSNGVIRPRMTLILRLQKGTTNALARRLLNTSSRRLTLPVLVESAYHSNPKAQSDLAHCSTILAFAGGVGITGVLPLVKTHPGVRARLFWGVRDASLIQAVEPEFLADVKAKPGVQVQTKVGERFDVREVVREELVGREGVEEGDLGVIVCGPPGMADDVRAAVVEYGSKSKRGVVFVDEAFAW